MLINRKGNCKKCGKQIFISPYNFFMCNNDKCANHVIGHFCNECVDTLPKICPTCGSKIITSYEGACKHFGGTIIY